jgi:hypothetical protein
MQNYLGMILGGLIVLLSYQSGILKKLQDPLKTIYCKILVCVSATFINLSIFIALICHKYLRNLYNVKSKPGKVN